MALGVRVSGPCTFSASLWSCRSFGPCSVVVACGSDRDGRFFKVPGRCRTPNGSIGGSGSHALSHGGSARASKGTRQQLGSNSQPCTPCRARVSGWRASSTSASQDSSARQGLCNPRGDTFIHCTGLLRTRAVKPNAYRTRGITRPGFEYDSRVSAGRIRRRCAGTRPVAHPHHYTRLARQRRTMKRKL